MGSQRLRPPGARAGRHRRGGQALVVRREHRERARRRPIPAPTPSALVGIAVLVLIGAGVIHLSSSGSAVPRQTDPPTAAAAGPSSTADPTTEPPAAATSAPAEEETAAATGVVVHVSGAVEQPGLVDLPAGARVDDAVEAAGGVSGQADLTAVNLARPLVDGEQIHVPRPGETPPAAAAPAPGTTGGDGSTGGAAVDVNTAGASELEQLPGVGPAIAERILEHREKNGPFRSVDDLAEVSGIGPATLEDIREGATV